MTHATIPSAAFADFAPTQLLFRDETDACELDNDFAPTQILMTEAMPSWRDPAFDGVVLIRPAPRAPWLGRVADLIDRVLPGGFGSLLGLFLCVSMSIVLISAMLPLVDRA
jgi:hypothetical protein